MLGQIKIHIVTEGVDCGCVLIRNLTHYFCSEHNCLLTCTCTYMCAAVGKKVQ